MRQEGIANSEGTDGVAEDTSPLRFGGTELQGHRQQFKEYPGARVRPKGAYPGPMQEPQKSQTRRVGSGNRQLADLEEGG